MICDKLILQSNLPDSGAIIQVWSDKPLSVADVQDAIEEFQLLLRQAQRREAKKETIA